jgi:hypothetical protein
MRAYEDRLQKGLDDLRRTREEAERLNAKK